jgi:hypothetical protein
MRSVKDIKGWIEQALLDIHEYQQKFKDDPSHYQSLYNCQSVLSNLSDYINGGKDYRKEAILEGEDKIKTRY